MFFLGFEVINNFQSLLCLTRIREDNNDHLHIHRWPASVYTGKLVGFMIDGEGQIDGVNIKDGSNVYAPDIKGIDFSKFSEGDEVVYIEAHAQNIDASVRLLMPFEPAKEFLMFKSGIRLEEGKDFAMYHGKQLIADIPSHRV